MIEHTQDAELEASLRSSLDALMALERRRAGIDTGQRDDDPQVIAEIEALRRSIIQAREAARGSGVAPLEHGFVLGADQIPDRTA